MSDPTPAPARERADPELDGHLLAEMQARVGDATSDLSDIQVDARTHGWQDIEATAAAAEDMLNQLHAEITKRSQASGPRTDTEVERDTR